MTPFNTTISLYVIILILCIYNCGVIEHLKFDDYQNDDYQNENYQDENYQDDETPTNKIWNINNYISSNEDNIEFTREEKISNELVVSGIMIIAVIAIMLTIYGGIFFLTK
jgi:sortase (surface protein transpeptidase)